VQTAAVLVLEPIFEADLTAEQYAYRAEHSARDAVQQVYKQINTGHGRSSMLISAVTLTVFRTPSL
jgi:retron-type reverse transcriptase